MYCDEVLSETNLLTIDVHHEVFAVDSKDIVCVELLPWWLIRKIKEGRTNILDEEVWCERDGLRKRLIERFVQNG